MEDIIVVRQALNVSSQLDVSFFAVFDGYFYLKILKLLILVLGPDILIINYYYIMIKTKTINNLFKDMVE
jgi:hypothetical protein